MSQSAGKTGSADGGRSIAERIGRAVACHQRGELGEAQRHYQAILKTHPKQFDALYCLGVLELQLGNTEAAHRLLRQALRINPGSADAHSGMGNVYHAQKKFAASLQCYDRALAIRPDYAEAHNNRGNALLDLGRHQPALDSFDRALAISPDYAEALNSRGNALHGLGRYAEAVASYDRALAVAPGFADALNSRGNALHATMRHAEALECYEQALAIEPDFVDALNNRGNALRSLGRNEEALASYGQALSSDPCNLEALNPRSLIYANAGRHDEATRDFERILTLAPGLGYLRGNLLHSRMHCCDWRNYVEESRRIIAEVRGGMQTTSPFMFLSVSESVEDQLACARLWVKDKVPAARPALWKGERYGHDRIRIAYLSADLCDHAVAHLTARMFELHDRMRFEITAISFGADKPGDMRTRLKSAFDRFIDVGQTTDREVAVLLRELEIDIAVDLNGHTGDARPAILASRPAPVQVSYLGFPGTLGADYIDYILGDRMVIPAEHQPRYAEKVVYLPDSYLANDSTRRIAEHTPTRAQVGLPDHGFVFCAFGMSYKITPSVFAQWMNLLRQVEGSVLWLSENNAAAMRNLRREASERGISPQRLVFAPRVPDMADHLARQRLADLYLDTLPYNAHTSAADALWVGLPVLTCVGTTFAGRVAASLLNAVGLPELVTHSQQQYEALALRLATQPGLLSDIKAGLARNRESYPLFDSDRFRLHIEAAYTKMWERSQRGDSPISFAVEPSL